MSSSPARASACVRTWARCSYPALRLPSHEQGVPPGPRMLALLHVLHVLRDVHRPWMRRDGSSLRRWTACTCSSASSGLTRTSSRRSSRPPGNQTTRRHEGAGPAGGRRQAACRRYCTVRHAQKPMPVPTCLCQCKRRRSMHVWPAPEAWCVVRALGGRALLQAPSAAGRRRGLLLIVALCSCATGRVMCRGYQPGAA